MDARPGPRRTTAHQSLLRCCGAWLLTGRTLVRDRYGEPTVLVANQPSGLTGSALAALPHRRPCPPRTRAPPRDTSEGAVLLVRNRVRGGPLATPGVAGGVPRRPAPRPRQRPPTGGTGPGPGHPPADPPRPGGRADPGRPWRVRRPGRSPGPAWAVPWRCDPTPRPAWSVHRGRSRRDPPPPPRGGPPIPLSRRGIPGAPAGARNRFPTRKCRLPADVPRNRGRHPRPRARPPVDSVPRGPPGPGPPRIPP